MQWSVVSGQRSVLGIFLLAAVVCGGCVTTTTVSEPHKSSLNPHAAPSGVSALKVYVDTVGSLSFNDRLYTTPDLAKALQRQGDRPVELIGREGVTQAQLGLITTNLFRLGVHNVNMVMPRRISATVAE